MELNLFTLTEKREQLINDWEQAYLRSGIVIDARSPGTVFTEQINCMAAESYADQQRFLWLAAQQFAETMDDDILIKKAARKGVTRILGNVARGHATLTGTVGKIVEKGTLLQSASGLQFITKEAVTFNAGTAIVEIEALKVGTAGNLAAGTPLTFLQPLPGVLPNGTVNAPGLAGGADIESLDRLRARYSRRLVLPPRGGCPHDYETWALQAHVDVTRAFVTEHEEVHGQVIVRIVTEDLDTPIPTAAHVQTVEDYINQPHVRPPGVRNFKVLAPTPKPLDLVFTSISPNTPAVKAAVEAEVADLLRQSGKNNMVLPISHIRAAISNASGEMDYVLQQNSNVAIAVNEFPVPGTFTWP